MSKTPNHHWTPSAIPDLTGKIAVVTGGNSGLGYHTAVHLAAHGALTVVTARSPEKLADALRALEREVPAGAFAGVLLDLADLDSVRDAASQIADRYDHLDLLINNAGVMAPPRGETAQGSELQFGVNHLGHFALTGLLWPLILRTPESRVINLSSTAGYLGAMGWDDLDSESRYGRYRAYGQSKLANLLFTRSLDRMYRDSGNGGLSAAAHPGLASTNLQRRTAEASGSGFERLIYRIIMPLFSQSAEQGAWPSLYAATASEIAGGSFYGPHRAATKGYPVEVKLPKRALNDHDAERLWQISIERTGVSFAPE